MLKSTFLGFNPQKPTPAWKLKIFKHQSVGTGTNFWGGCPNKRRFPTPHVQRFRTPPDQTSTEFGVRGRKFPQAAYGETFLTIFDQKWSILNQVWSNWLPEGGGGRIFETQKWVSKMIIFKNDHFFLHFLKKKWPFFKTVIFELGLKRLLPNSLPERGVRGWNWLFSGVYLKKVKKWLTSGAKI